MNAEHIVILPPCQRIPAGPADFGDDATVGVQVKRRGKTFFEYDPGLDFGEYLGEVAGTWVVAVYDRSLLLSRLEPFPTLAALKAVWEVD